MKPRKFSEAKKTKFLEWYAKCGRIIQACRAVDISRCTVLEHRKQFPDFEEQCQEAYQEFCESLEQEIERRGKDGVIDPIFQSGYLVGHKRVFSDSLMLAHAKRHIPEYREKHSVDVTHHGGVLVVPPIAKDSHEWERGSKGDEEDG